MLETCYRRKMKNSVTILGVKYASVAKAAEALKVSKSSLYRLLKAGEQIDGEIPNLQKSYGKKPKAKPVVIDSKKYKSVNLAATELEVSKTGLLKIIDSCSSQGELDRSVKSLIQNKRGSHKRGVTINGVAYASLTLAGKALGVGGGTISNWSKAQGTDDLVVDIDQLAFERLEKGSVVHMRALAHKAGFKTLSDWIKKDREGSGLGTFMKWLKDEWNNDLLAYLEKEYPGLIIEWWLMPRVPVGTWQKHERLKEYMHWLAVTLDYEKVSDWYRVKAKDFDDNYGEDNPVSLALNACSFFLYGVALRWILVHRLSPQHGFLHRPTDYPSLVYDLIEPYRYICERAVADTALKSDPDQLTTKALETIKRMMEETVYVPVTSRSVNQYKSNGYTYIFILITPLAILKIK